MVLLLKVLVVEVMEVERFLRHCLDAQSLLIHRWIGPVASKHGNRRSLLNAGSMALGRTTGRQRHGVGKGGDQERGGERTRGAGETGNGNRTATGEGGESGGGKGTMGGGKEKLDRWWGARMRTRGSTKEEVPIKFGTYNIRNGRNGGLESAPWGMAQANIDLGVFQETKCTDRIYTCELAGYRVIAGASRAEERGPWEGERKK